MPGIFARAFAASHLPATITSKAPQMGASQCRKIAFAFTQSLLAASVTVIPPAIQPSKPAPTMTITESDP